MLQGSAEVRKARSPPSGSSGNSECSLIDLSRLESFTLSVPSAQCQRRIRLQAVESSSASSLWQATRLATNLSSLTRQLTRCKADQAAAAPSIPPRRHARNLACSSAPLAYFSGLAAGFCSVCSLCESSRAEACSQTRQPVSFSFPIASAVDSL